MTAATFTRGVTIVAVGFLLLDAILFALVSRFIWAGVCGAAAALVVIGWRRYRREVESLRALLHTHRQN